jgi:hypothetical protein
VSGLEIETVARPAAAAGAAAAAKIAAVTPLPRFLRRAGTLEPPSVSGWSKPSAATAMGATVLTAVTRTLDTPTAGRAAS